MSIKAAVKFGVQEHLRRLLQDAGPLKGAKIEVNEDGQPYPASGNIFVAVHNARYRDIAPSGSYYRHEVYGFDVTLSVKTAFLQSAQRPQVAIDEIGRGLHTLAQTVVNTLSGRLDTVDDINNYMVEHLPQEYRFTVGIPFRMTGNTDAVPRSPEWWGKPDQVADTLPPNYSKLPKPAGPPAPEGYSVQVSFDGAERIAEITEQFVP